MLPKSSTSKVGTCVAEEYAGYGEEYPLPAIVQFPHCYIMAEHPAYIQDASQCPRPPGKHHISGRGHPETKQRQDYCGGQQGQGVVILKIGVCGESERQN